MLCTAFLWSLAGVFIKVIEWPPLAIVCTRSLVATITMYLFVRKQKFEWSWPMLAAALSYTAFTYCIILSTKLTTSANAVMMQYRLRPVGVVSGHQHFPKHCQLPGLSATGAYLSALHLLYPCQAGYYLRYGPDDQHLQRLQRYRGNSGKQCGRRDRHIGCASGGNCRCYRGCGISGKHSPLACDTTAPIYVAFLSWFFLKEKIRKSDWFCLIAVIGGMALFFMDQMGGGSNLIGNIIAIGNGLSFAFLAPAPTTEHPKRIAAYQSFCVSPHSGIWASVREFMKKEKKP